MMLKGMGLGLEMGTGAGGQALGRGLVVVPPQPFRGCPTLSSSVPRSNYQAVLLFSEC